MRTAFAVVVVAALASAPAGASELRKIQATHLESQFFLEYPEAVVVSPDGANVYTVSASTGGDAAAVHAFARASDGTLSPIGSLAMGNPGAVPLAIAISPDGRDVYAQAGSEDIAILARDPTTGVLSASTDPMRDISSHVTVSPDGKNVYATFPQLLVTYARDAATGALTRIDLENGYDGPAPIYDAAGLAISPDGRNVYLGSHGATPAEPVQTEPGPSLIVFARDPVSGTLDYVTALFQGENGVDGLALPIDVAVSADGRSVYVSGANGHADDVATFARDASGGLTYLGKAAGAGFPDGGEMALSPDGERVIVLGRQLYQRTVNDGFSVFRRDPASGLLTYLETTMRVTGTIDLNYPTGVAFAPDARNLYVTAGLDQALLTYRVLPHCSIAPLDGCRAPTRPHRSQLLLTRGSRDALLWKWRSGEATTLADLGDPEATTDYTFCVHREVGGAWQAPLQLQVAGGSTCGHDAQPCWRRSGAQPSAASDVFRDPAALQDGVTELRLRPGGDGHAALLLRARGAALDLPPLPLGSPDRVVAQLESSDGACWGAGFTGPPTADDARRFADTSD